MYTTVNLDLVSPAARGSRKRHGNDICTMFLIELKSSHLRIN